MPLSEEKKRLLGLEERGVKCIFFVVRPDGTQLISIGKLAEVRAVKGVVEEVFTLERGAQAMELVESGRARGKVVLQIVLQVE